jgi:hypothetical protein
MRIVHYQKSFSDGKIEESNKDLTTGYIACAALILGGFLYFFIGRSDPSQLWWIIPIVVIAALALKGLKGRHSLLQELGWAQRGTDGEIAVVRIFGEKLDDSYTYICNYSNPNFRGGDIDGVLIGPKGVFVIEVKNWRGSFRVSGPDIYKHIAGDEYRLFKSPIDQVNYATEFIKQIFERGSISAPVRSFVILEGGYVKEFRGSTGVFISSPEKVLQEIMASRAVNSDHNKILTTLGIHNQKTPNLVQGVM